MGKMRTPPRAFLDRRADEEGIWWLSFSGIKLLLQGN
jgi:hypothetical protein